MRRAFRPPAPGRNLATTFNKDVSLDRDMLWWFHQGNRAIRVGDWKLVAARDEPWQLFDLKQDRAENNDLSTERVEQAQELERLWLETAQRFEKLSETSAP